jgi:hypothetical protein
MSPVDLFLYYHFQGMILLCSSRCKCLSSICRDDRGHRTSHRSKNHGVIRNDPKLHCTKVLRRTPCRTHAFSNAHFVAKVRVDPLIEAVGGHRSTLWSKFFRPFLPILSYTCIRAESPRGATDLNVNCTDVRITRVEGHWPILQQDCEMRIVCGTRTIPVGSQQTGLLLVLCTLQLVRHKFSNHLESYKKYR